MSNANVVDFIQLQFKTRQFIPLHEPRFVGNEKKYLNDCIDSTFVSSVGKYVDDFEKNLANYTGAKYAIACANGTSALHMAMIVAEVNENDLVITQPISFIATCNAISYIGAQPLFIDVDLDTMGLSPSKLKDYLLHNTQIKADGFCYHNITNQKIAVCVPMHTFGHPCKIDEIAEVCHAHNIILIEDSAESMGSFYKQKHTGTFGTLGVFSFNGNKTITSGGGGAIITNNEQLAHKAKHLTTQAKVPHRWEFIHDEIGYNYRMPNINAALLCAQLENLTAFINNKRELALNYEQFLANTDIKFIVEPIHSKANYWLCSVMLKDRISRDAFLQYTNDNGVMTRPIWTLTNKLKMFDKCLTGDLHNSILLEDTIVNIPSSVRIN